MANPSFITIDLDDPRQLRVVIKSLQQSLWKLERECEHKCVASNPKDLLCSHPVCTKCDQHLSGWFCPESESGECNYQQEDGSYNPDHCVHCGQPDERK
jgi:hypothetical protein